jgi:hypothetical protein
VEHRPRLLPPLHLLPRLLHRRAVRLLISRRSAPTYVTPLRLVQRVSALVCSNATSTPASTWSRPSTWSTHFT